MDFMTCNCGQPVVIDGIYCIGKDDRLVRIAAANTCFKCRKVHSIRMAIGHPEQVTIGMVERAYRKSLCNIFSWEELKTGEVRGIQSKSNDYNPDEYIET